MTEYELWKKHAIESLWLFNIISLIENKNFTCDQLQAIIHAIEDMKGSDYEDNKEQDLDMYDSVRDSELEQL